jgi:hypothetical protein
MSNISRLKMSRAKGHKYNLQKFSEREQMVYLVFGDLG